MIENIKTLNEINIKAIHILKNEMGLENTIRFLNQFSTGSGDYTENGKEIYNTKSVSDIVSEIRKNKYK